MTFEEIVRSKILDLNTDKTYEGNFRTYFSSRLEEYLNLISQVDDESLSFKNIKLTNSGIIAVQNEFIDGLKQTMELYYDGQPSKAYEKLKTTINQRLRKYKRLFKIGTYKANEDFYRIRTLNGNSRRELENFFHIPFQFREKVSTQRFSIPGFPSLYLGRSIYVCWEELNRPNLRDFKVVRLQTKKAIKFIDLAPPCLKSNVNSVEFYKYLMTWPLIFACSIQVKYPNEVFKPEYIIPQLLLQWTRQKKEIDGIRYWSTYVYENTSSFSGELYNIVLPVKDNLDSGLCNKLSNIFEGTEVVSWQSIELSTGGGTYLSTSEEAKKIDEKMEYLELIKGMKYQYSSSIFGSMEQYLSFLELRKIKNNS